MKAITIHPVWAWAIVHGHKPVENRTWRTKHRGPLLIHASAVSPASKRSDAIALAIFTKLGIEVPETVPTGAIVGRVELVDCIARDGADAGAIPGPEELAGGPVCFVLAQPEAFEEPIPWRGMQRFFEVPEVFTTKTPRHKKAARPGVAISAAIG
jgi:hypothetical protein